jgi:hypothetical protein
MERKHVAMACLKQTVKLVSNAAKHLRTVWMGVLFFGFFFFKTILFLSSTSLQGSRGETVSHNQTKPHMTTAPFYRQKNKQAQRIYKAELGSD